MLLSIHVLLEIALHAPMGEKKQKGALQNHRLSNSSDAHPSERSLHPPSIHPACRFNGAYWGGDVSIDFEPNAGAAVPFDSPTI